MTTLGTTGCNHPATALGTLADKEAVGALATDHGRLIGTLHDFSRVSTETRDYNP